MFLKTPSGRLVELPTDREEDAAIRMGIATAADDHALSGVVPSAAVPKIGITVRLSPEVVEKFRATGQDWQMRVDDALKDWLQTHPNG